MAGITHARRRTKCFCSYVYPSVEPKKSRTPAMLYADAFDLRNIEKRAAPGSGKQDRASDATNRGKRRRVLHCGSTPTPSADANAWGAQLWTRSQRQKNKTPSRVVFSLLWPPQVHQQQPKIYHHHHHPAVRMHVALRTPAVTTTRARATPTSTSPRYTHLQRHRDALVLPQAQLLEAHQSARVAEPPPRGGVPPQWRYQLRQPLRFQPPLNKTTHKTKQKKTKKERAREGKTISESSRGGNVWPTNNLGRAQTTAR